MENLAYFRDHCRERSQFPELLAYRIYAFIFGKIRPDFFFFFLRSYVALLHPQIHFCPWTLSHPSPPLGAREREKKKCCSQLALLKLSHLQGMRICL